MPRHLSFEERLARGVQKYPLLTYDKLLIVLVAGEYDQKNPSFAEVLMELAQAVAAASSETPSQLPAWRRLLAYHYLPAWQQLLTPALLHPWT